MEPSLSFAPQKKHRQGAAEALRILYSGYLTIEIDDKAFLKPYKKKKNMELREEREYLEQVFVTNA